MEPREVSSQQTRPALAASRPWLDSILRPSTGTNTHFSVENRGSNDGAGRQGPQSFGESSPAHHSGLNAAQSASGNANSSAESLPNAHSTRETQFVRPPNRQRRSCMPILKQRSIRRRLYTLIPSAVLLIAIIAFYLAISTTARLGREIHILLIFMILILSIVFCHSLIRFAMVILQDSRSVARNRVPSRSGPMGYAQPDRPIHVILAGDEEALVETEGAIREKVTAPPPAYGLWRSSVRINPDLLYWQRLEDNERSHAIGHRTGRSNRKTLTPRPPSYTSDDGVDYIMEAQPRPLLARHDAEDARRP